MKKIIIFLWMFTKTTIIPSALIIFVFFYLIQPFRVSGASMNPVCADGQYLILNKLNYKLNYRITKLKHGDIIVFKYPLDTSQYYIKRIIGLPGEIININGNEITIYNSYFPDGEVLDESSYLSAREITYGSIEIELGADEYFVLGDNREESSDSRKWGVLAEKYIIGRVWLRVWPFNLFELL